MRFSTSIAAALAMTVAISCSEVDDTAKSVSAVEEQPGTNPAHETVELTGLAADYVALVEADGRIPEDEAAFRLEFDATLASADPGFNVSGTSLHDVGCSVRGCFVLVAHDSGGAQRDFLQSPYSGGSPPFGEEGYVDPGEPVERPTTFIMTSRIGGPLPALDEE